MRFCVHDTVATRGQYLALSKTRHYLFILLLQYCYNIIVLLLPRPRSICDTRRLSVGLLAALHKKLHTNLAEIFTEGETWLNLGVIQFGGDPDQHHDQG